MPHALVPHNGLKAICSRAHPQVPAAAGGEGETESAGAEEGWGDAHCFFSRVVMVTSCLAALAMS